jgi:hypothetical protein
MSDRGTELRQLAVELQEYEAVEDAFVAKSFTDRLLIVDVGEGDGVPGAVTDRLAAHDLYGADGVYGDDDEHRSFVGSVGDATRHHFVDVRTRGSHQSYVVD